MRKALSALNTLDSHARSARRLKSIAAEFRSGSTPASRCASLMCDKGLSRSHAKRIVRSAAALSGVESAVSKRRRAIADTVERLLAGSPRKECRERLICDRSFTPKQVRMILHKACKEANLEEYFHDENFDEQAKALQFLDLV